MSRYVRRKLPTDVKKRLWSINRIVSRDGGSCYLCHKEFESMSDITLDHLIPKSKGGKDTMDNLRLAHDKCNKAKRDLTIEEFAILQEGF